MDMPGKALPFRAYCVQGRLLGKLGCLVEDLRRVRPGQRAGGVQGKTAALDGTNRGCCPVRQFAGGFRAGLLLPGQIQGVLQHHADFCAGDAFLRAKGLLVGKPGGESGPHGGGQIGLEPAGNFIGTAGVGQSLIHRDVQRLDQHGDKFSPGHLPLGREAGLLRHGFSGENTGVPHPFRSEAAVLSGGIGVLTGIRGF